MNKIYCIFLALTILSSCSKDRVINPPKDDVPDVERFEGFVDFTDPLPGQKSRYIKYESVCDDMNSEFRFTGDTIVFEVAELNGQVIFREFYTAGSPAQISYPDQEPIEYTFDKNGNDLLIPDRFQSHLFFFYGNDTIRLNPVEQVELAQNGCMLDLGSSTFIGDEIGFVKDFAIGPIEIKDKIAVSCVPILDLDAYLIYNRHHLYMSHTVVSSSFGGETWMQIQGFKLLTQ